jgi:ferrous iron transport protein B
MSSTAAHASPKHTAPNLTVALVGAPNCGKSTIFNALTGLRQKVGNFPGVTVEPKRGDAHIDKTTTHLVDLPGMYSLLPKTPDEALSVAVLLGQHERLPMPEAVVFVMEGTNLEKSLFLYAQFAALNIPTVVAVTMIDSIKASGGVFDDITMEHALGVPVIGIVGHRGIGLEELREHLALRGFSRPEARQNHIPADGNIEAQHEWARNLATEVARIPELDSLTTKLDAFFLHPVAGPLIFLAVMLVFFQAIFVYATPMMDAIEAGFGALQRLAEAVLPAGIVQDFVSRGVIAGVGAVMVFLPQILILTLFITLLEDFGYLARGAFLVDRIMGVFGLQGRSFIPLLSSFACAIPGIMSARIIASEKDRLTTILIAPLMPCSARLPVYVLLITAFVPSATLGGVISVQGLILMGLYALGALSGLVAAKILKSTVFQGSKLPFLMELPPYRFPTWSSVAITLFNRTKQFLTSAGTTILVLSIILWALGAFPRHTSPAGANPTQAASLQLEHSALGTIGKTLEPVFAPIGFDWKVTIGVLGSFAAREVFVAVMGQVYSVDVSESDENLRTILRGAISLPTALSILVFYVYALQCMSTIAVMKRETGSWKYPAIAFVYTLALAYSASLLVFHLAK